MATMMKLDAGKVTQAKDVFLVSPDQVDADPANNPRNAVSASGLEAPFDPDALAALEADIEAKGQQIPCLVTRDATTYKLSMVEGWTRHAIATKLGRQLLVRVVTDLDAEGAYTLAVKANCIRGSYATSAKASAAQHMKESYNYDDQKIADVLGCSLTHVANLWALLGAPAPIKEAVSAGAMTAASAIESTRAGLSDEQVSDLANRVRAKQAEAAAAGGGKKKAVKQSKVREITREIKGKATEKAEANGAPAPSGPAAKTKRTARHLLKALDGRKHKSMPLSTVLIKFLEGDWTDENAASKLLNLLDKYELASDLSESDAD